MVVAAVSVNARSDTGSALHRNRATAWFLLRGSGVESFGSALLPWFGFKQAEVNT